MPVARQAAGAHHLNHFHRFPRAIIGFKLSRFDCEWFAGPPARTIDRTLRPAQKRDCI
jgi:hypothetical protein